MNFKLLFFIFLILSSILCILLLNNAIDSKVLKYLIILIKFILLYILYIYLFPSKKYNIEVLQDKPDPELASKLIIKVNQNLDKLLKHINEKYSNDNLDKIPANQMNFKKKIFIRNVLKDLNKNYKSFKIKENFPIISNHKTSYNVNKGENIYLCLRNYSTNEFHNFNDIMFVAIHELTHCCHHSTGHNKDFWAIFRFLLENANDINMYKFINYKKNPYHYCSTKVTYNPVFDNTLDDRNYFK
jgi:hypothetical protein